MKNLEAFKGFNAPTRFCKLDDGSIKKYSLCHSETYQPGGCFRTDCIRYLGTGTIFNIEGILQEGDRRYHFFEWIGAERPARGSGEAPAFLG